VIIFFFGARHYLKEFLPIRDKCDRYQLQIGSFFSLITYRTGGDFDPVSMFQMSTPMVTFCFTSAEQADEEEKNRLTELGITFYLTLSEQEKLAIKHYFQSIVNYQLYNEEDEGYVYCI